MTRKESDDLEDFIAFELTSEDEGSSRRRTGGCCAMAIPVVLTIIALVAKTLL
ncbi:MAG: hypothetical protein HYX78_01385 [Armatimonadetes bacterium]|nr:hypothetical protein [Armatimonadota bacterium]